MIKLGFKHEACYLDSTGIHIINYGKIIFNRSGIIGNGAFKKYFTVSQSVLAGIPAKTVSKRIIRYDLLKVSKLSNWHITSGFKYFNSIPNC